MERKDTGCGDIVCDMPQEGTPAPKEEAPKKKTLKGMNPATFLLVSSCLTGGTQGLQAMRGLRHTEKSYEFTESDAERIRAAEAKRKRKADRKSNQDSIREMRRETIKPSKTEEKLEGEQG